MIGGAVLVGIGLLVAWMLPRYLAPRVAAALTARLGSSVTIVTAAPCLPFSLSLRDVQSARGTAATIRLDIDPQSLLAGPIRVAAVTADEVVAAGVGRARLVVVTRHGGKVSTAR